MQGKDICFLQVSQLSSGVWWAVYQQAWKAASGSIPLTSPAGTSRSLQFFITMLKSHFQAIIWQIWGMMQSKINGLTRCFMQVQCYEGGFSSWLDEHSKLCWMDTLVRSRLCLLACWGSRLKGSNRVHKLICKGSKTVGMELDFESKLRTMLDTSSNPLNDVLASHMSRFGESLRIPKCTTEQHRKSFLPVAASWYNPSM